MSTDQLASDSRSISELYGTVLIIAISFLTAMLLFGFGTFLLGNIGGDTEDRITQDSMFEMEDRLAEISGSQVDSTTQFSVPDTDGDDLETMPDHGTVNVTVENTTALEYLEASDESNTTEFDVGTIKHETDDGIVTAYQGGAMIRQQGDFSTILTDPPFDYDGTMVAFDFVDTTSMPGAQPGQEITARTNVEGAQAFSEEIEDLLSPKWSYLGEGDFIAPINVTVSIETEYYEAWEEYAEEGMTESPDSVETDSADGMVKMKFNQVGTKEQLSGYAENQILYAGSADDISEGFNRFNDNATINRTEAGFEMNPMVGNENAFENQRSQLAYYDEERGEWLRIGQNNNPDEPPSGDVESAEWFDLEGNVVYGDVTSPVEIDDFELSNNDDYIRYELNESHSDVPLCLIAYDENINSADSEGVIDYLETCAANMPNSEEYMPTDLEISFEDTSYNLTKGDEENLLVEIENVGNVDAESGQDIALYYELNNTVKLGNSTTFEEEVKSNESHEEEIKWEPPSTAIEEIYAVVGSHDSGNASVNITDEGLNVAETLDFFEIDEDSSMEESIVPGQPLTLEPTINNSGTEDGEQSISLTTRGSNAILDVETVEIETGDSKDVSLTWDTPTIGTQIVEINTEDYAKVLEIDVSNPLSDDRDINTPLDIDIDIIEFEDS